MTQVTVGENEGIESALRRFKRQVSKSGIFADLKKTRHHENLLKNTKESYNKEEKQEEDNLIDFQNNMNFFNIFHSNFKNNKYYLRLFSFLTRFIPTPETEEDLFRQRK